jgi:hypothetical protein
MVATNTFKDYRKGTGLSYSTAEQPRPRALLEYGLPVCSAPTLCCSETEELAQRGWKHSNSSVRHAQGPAIFQRAAALCGIKAPTQGRWNMAKVERATVGTKPRYDRVQPVISDRCSL